MPGRTPRGFRIGNLAEELGVLLLKAIAAVATVSRPEDVGIDAIATLLRKDSDNQLYAENSFYVQFKSSLKDLLISYSGHEVRWLENHKLPFLIGFVNRDNGVLDLYATHRMSLALLEASYQTIEVVLDPNFADAERGIDPKTERVTNDTRRVNIGPPLLSWSLKDATNQVFIGLAYDSLKTYLDAEQRNVDNRAVRYNESITWKTNGVPLAGRSSSGFQSLKDGSETSRILGLMVPYVQFLALRAWSTKNKKLLALVVQLGEYMRQNGCDFDPHRSKDTLLRDWDTISFPCDLLPTPPLPSD